MDFNEIEKKFISGYHKHDISLTSQCILNKYNVQKQEQVEEKEVSPLKRFVLRNRLLFTSFVFVSLVAGVLSYAIGDQVINKQDNRRQNELANVQGGVDGEIAFQVYSAARIFSNTYDSDFNPNVKINDNALGSRTYTPLGKKLSSKDPFLSENQFYNIANYYVGFNDTIRSLMKEDLNIKSTIYEGKYYGFHGGNLYNYQMIFNNVLDVNDFRFNIVPSKHDKDLLNINGEIIVDTTKKISYLCEGSIYTHRNPLEEEIPDEDRTPWIDSIIENSLSNYNMKFVIKKDKDTQIEILRNYELGTNVYSYSIFNRGKNIYTLDVEFSKFYDTKQCMVYLAVHNKRFVYALIQFPEHEEVCVTFQAYNTVGMFVVKEDKGTFTFIYNHGVNDGVYEIVIE